jgi:hypothetical protein
MPRCGSTVLRVGSFASNLAVTMGRQRRRMNGAAEQRFLRRLRRGVVERFKKRNVVGGMVSGRSLLAGTRARTYNITNRPVVTQFEIRRSDGIRKAKPQYTPRPPQGRTRQKTRLGRAAWGFQLSILCH